MRRTWLCCALFFLTVATAAWADPEGGGRSSASPGVAATPQLARASAVLFGDTSVQQGVRQTARSSTSFFRFTDRRTGMARSIDLYVGSSSTAKSVLAGVYTAAAHGPGSLRGAGTLSSPRLGAWNTIAIRPALVNAGHSYWIAVLGERGTLFLRDTGNSCTSTGLGSGRPGATVVSLGCRTSVYVSSTSSVVHGPAQLGTGTTQTDAVPTLPDTQTTGDTTAPPATRPACPWFPLMPPS